MLVPGTLVLGLLLFGFWPWLPFSSATAPRRTVVFYGFSILAEPIERSVFPEFRRLWHDKTGEQIELISSFGGSGTVTNQVIMGVPAELVMVAHEPDADRLARAGLVEHASWRSLPHHGIVNRTPIVILVRPGNPKQVRGFDDLARPGIGVVHPDPQTSGGASWAILAEYGAGLRSGGPAEGTRLLRGIWKNVVAQASSARSARTQFENGFGDALVTYEQDVLTVVAAGKAVPAIVYPRSTIMCEHLLLIVRRNVPRRDEPAVSALADFLWSETGQAMFVAGGFRSVEDALNARRADFGAITDPFFVDDLGGWPKARAEIIEGVWKKLVLPEIGR